VPDVTTNRSAFAARCRARDRERQLGTGYGFGIFAEERFCGEINVNGVQRGPFQSAYVGYWVDEACAGRGYCPEAVVVLARHCFEELALHRLQIAIIPRNAASRRVVEKLCLRDEGVAAPLPRDQRDVGGPHPLRHHGRGVAGPAQRAAPDVGAAPA
jgi:ribosomal-protein-alanine N-acetyltransferase